eukprot:COSAG06_NODE_883_length_11788_cov_4.031568_8_plen_94_part_00
MLTGTHVEVLSLLERKGFVRLALQHGRDLVPVYGFGENRAFKQCVQLHCANCRRPSAASAAAAIADAWVCEHQGMVYQLTARHGVGCVQVHML